MKKIYPSERAATKATLRAEAAPFAPISFAQIYAAEAEGLEIQWWHHFERRWICCTSLHDRSGRDGDPLNPWCHYRINPRPTAGNFFFWPHEEKPFPKGFFYQELFVDSSPFDILEVAEALSESQTPQVAPRVAGGERGRCCAK